jgi:hypothetical protein
MIAANAFLSRRFCGGGSTKMISRNLIRRLEDLETQLRPAVGETKTLTIRFVNPDGTVMDDMDIPVTCPAPTSHGPRARRWQR